MTYETLSAKFRLDPVTGFIYDRSTGRRTGSLNREGYRRIRYWHGDVRVEIAEHRLVWLLHTGAWPLGYLDHINRIRDDNRPTNLRHCTRTQNMANTGLDARNKSGYRGVRRSGKKWGASIQANGKAERWLGTFDTPEAAAAVYERAYFEEYGNWLRGGP